MLNLVKNAEDISNAFDTWLAKYGFGEVHTGLGPDFAFFYEDDWISYGIALGADSIKQFDDLLDELDCHITIDAFYSAFLHELGHYMTLDTFTEQDLERSFAAQAKIERQVAEHLIDDIKADDLYFHLPVELAATRWAVRFMNEHLGAIEELYNTVQPLVNEFLTVNSLTNENIGEFIHFLEGCAEE